jgi:glycosyltransferase involved in cell wall biosynthesis
MNMQKTEKKRVCWVLPSNENKPIGGFKVVYQYANELSKRGYHVSIAFMYSPTGYQKGKLYNTLAKFLNQRFFLRKTHRREVTWFDFDPRVRLYYDIIYHTDLPECDATIATASNTAGFVARFSKAKSFYFIQDYETERFNSSVDEVNLTYRLGLTNIVISHELEGIVREATGMAPQYLPNFYDKSEFFLARPIENRENRICLINHESEIKRTKLGLDILAEVKKEVADLRVELFGAIEAPKGLPDYVSFTYQATSQQLREDIYGQSKIYLLPSVREGWVLTGMEAMASGAAVVASLIGGISDYANDSNAVLIRPDDKAAFVEAIVSLLTDDSKRERIARMGCESVAQYTMKKSATLLEEILEKDCEEAYKI